MVTKISHAFHRTAVDAGGNSAIGGAATHRWHIEADMEPHGSQEGMFGAVFDSASYPIIAEMLDGTIMAWNSAAERLFQYTAAEAVGRNIDMIIPADRLEENRAMRAKALKGEPIEDFDTIRLARNGRRIDVALSVCPIKSELGEVIGVVKIARDLTAKRLTEETFRLAVELCPSGLVMVDGAGNIVMANGEIERQFGYSRVELIGQSIEILVPETMRVLHMQYRGSFASKPEARRAGAGRDLLGRRKDGSEFPVEVGLNPVETHEGMLVFGVIVDISERKRIERLKDEFVATVSHELRTPLTSISASLGLLVGAADVKLPEAAKRLVTIAHSNSQRLVRLINDILDVEKIESGKVIFNLQRVEVGTLVAQAIDANLALAASYGVGLRFEETSASEVRTDPDRLMQVVTNLLSNAINFSPRDSEVVVAIENSGENVRVTVRDHGPGISADFRPRIFDKFAQADGSNSRQKGGSGLGLSIVKQIVTQLGGKVDFSDAPGGGAVFYVEIPRLHSVGHANAECKERLNGTHILLCEDDADLAAVMRDRFCQEGFATDVARTTASAIAQATTTAYSAVLVDLQLPDGDGISLIQELRARPQYGDTPIVVVSVNTGRGRDDVRSSCLNVLDWMSKPLDIPQLLRKLRPLIARNAGARLRVLHLDDDPDVLGIVAQSLDLDAQVVSVATVADARRALAISNFDLAVIDLALDGSPGLGLLTDLHDSAGDPIPVIVYSAQGANPVCAAQVRTALAKLRAPIDNLIANVRKQVAVPAPFEKRSDHDLATRSSH
ncbi:MAG TPA: PAS domain S-box protein [Xanthobacteraceae bacterium]|jgi:PAS domain S-box-containing protein|nr:PAS domain S-box protein [Xanthobacteraceae bacterium]